MKLKRIVALLLVAVLATFALASCGSGKYTVTFNSNGGSDVTSVEVEKDATVAEPTAPTKDGYVFAGWYADAALTDAWDFAADKVSDDVTIYAKWTPTAATLEKLADEALENVPAKVTMTTTSASGQDTETVENVIIIDGNNFEMEMNGVSLIYVDGVVYYKSGESKMRMVMSGSDAQSGLAQSGFSAPFIATENFDNVDMVEANGKYTVTCTGLKASAEDALLEAILGASLPVGYTVTFNEVELSFVVSDGKYESTTISCNITTSYASHTATGDISISTAFDYDVSAIEAPADADSYVWMAMSYEEYAEADVDSLVVIEGYVQDKQSWWNNKGTFYLQDKNGGAYFLYELACTKEEYDALVVGTKMQVVGYKAEWSGEVEIINATFTVIPGDTYVAPAFDITNLLDEVDLIRFQNRKVSFKNMTVVASNEDGAAFLYKWDGSGSADSDSDLYFKASVNGNTYTFVIEYYLTGPDSDAYKAVQALKVGDVIDMEGFLYWYEGAQPHITSVTVK
ncbi:MAG: InlB B-repeat-containing protein [Clostridia bacterium]|nr:InlB B-repeat-containing protein [Clostridia bacterium]